MNDEQLQAQNERLQKENLELKKAMGRQPGDLCDAMTELLIGVGNIDGALCAWIRHSHNQGLGFAIIEPTIEHLIRDVREALKQEFPGEEQGTKS